MCILCVIQKCSRRIATMLPWLVIPLIGLWAMSQLLPPAFRFEITSPRLACVMVLLVTLFWYEILMPQLSSWRAKRNALLRERMRFEAMEMQKLRKTATRKCRNCLTAYRDQNPCGGKFMCLFCGHISKRPVLDMPVAVEAGNSGILKDLIGKSGKILNAKAWSENGWICGHDWLDSNGGNWRKNCGDSFGYDEDDCLTKKSYPRSFVFACKLLATVSSSLMWLFRKLSRGSSSPKEDDALTDTDHRGMLENRGGNAGNIQESRGERARRKAEEKRLARLEKELLEEEERKQREDVARLVEERRKLRDEKMEAEKGSPKEAPPSSVSKETDSRKESERRRHERKREKDRGSSKSNSDVEELEKRAAGNKKTENDGKRDRPKAAHVSEHGYGVKGAAAGSRYFDRMRGTFLSSSRAFTRGGFFGKSANSAVIPRDHKPLENSQSSSTFRKDIATPVKSSHCEENKMVNSQRSTGVQSFTASNQSWIRLFPRSSTPTPPLSSDSNRKSPEKILSASGVPDSSTFSVGISNFPSGSSFTPPPVPFGSSSSSCCATLLAESFIPKHQFLPEDSEIFEDPCYVPDPISLLGPVSESLDNFQLDVGSEKQRSFVIPVGGEFTKPAPIESPLSRSRVSVARNPNPFLLFPNKSEEASNEMGIWKMWNSNTNSSSTSSSSTSPIDRIGGPAAVSWVFHPEAKKEGFIHPSPVKTMASLFKNDDPENAGEGSSWLPPRYGEVGSSSCSSSSSSAAANSWAKQEGSSARDGVVSPITRPHIGGLYSMPDVQSMWRFD